MMIDERKPDDLCPYCGVPQPFGRRGPSCSRCGYEFGAADESGHQAGHLTPFGYGVCGLIAGGHMGAGIALANQDAHLEDPRLVLFPMALGTACCLLAAWLGKRLDWRVRRGYESGLFGFMAAALTVFVLGLFEVSSTDTLIAAGAAVMVVATPLFRRAIYRSSGPPPGGGGQPM